MKIIHPLYRRLRAFKVASRAQMKPERLPLIANSWPLIVFV